MPDSAPTVLILGAGINGAAIARELTLAGANVVVVDTADAAGGATSASSRLVHGGLRYLEHGELGLVRESLAERSRLARLAPQFVRPLRLEIPVPNRWGGMVSSALGILGVDTAAPARGMWLVRIGLWLYERFGRDPLFPPHQVRPVGHPAAVAVDGNRYRWLCSYSDAQIRYPERFVLALLEDARQGAALAGTAFTLWTHHEAHRRGAAVEIRPVDAPQAPAVATLAPQAIVNATGAWVDTTLARLEVPSRKLMGGTKGSHFVTSHPRLRAMLCDKEPGDRDPPVSRGLYAEAPDGRPIFILPLGPGVLVGTTDEPFTGDPALAVAAESEIDYLLSAVNSILPDARLAREDLDFHYSGVRPLPASPGDRPAAITRRHWLEEHTDSEVPCFSVIGGKLTTCRSLAEQAARRILTRLGIESRSPGTRQRTLPGGENYPATPEELAREQARLAERHALSLAQVAAVWDLCGTLANTYLADLALADRASLPDTDLPRGFARRVVEREWASRLEDLVERRLMLLYHQRLTRATLRGLAGLLVEAGHLPAAQVDAEIERTIARLAARHGKRVVDDPSPHSP